MQLAVILLTACLYTPPVLALSCAPPRITNELLEATPIFFEGTVIKSRDLTQDESTSLKTKNVGFKGGELKDVRVYILKVVGNVKGVKKGQMVNVLRNTYWGDGFTIGQRYMVFPTTRYNNLYKAALCGPSFNTSMSGQVEWVQAALQVIQAFLSKQPD